MSDYAQDDSSPPRHGSDASLPNYLDDAANNSLIGKVKSRVSSIFPNRLSKWFSPSSKLQNDSLNGSMCGTNTTMTTRRRRRIEVEEEEEEEQSYEDDEVPRCEEYERANNNMYSKRNRNVDIVDENDDEDDDDDSQNSEEEFSGSSIQQPSRDLNAERQPPAKRSRLNIEIRDSPIQTRQQPLLSSTPAVSSTYMRNAALNTSGPRTTNQRYTHFNFYGNQSKKDPPFNFGQQKESKLTTKTNTDIIDLITNSSYEQEDKLTEFRDVYGDSSTGMGSRRSLNIPSTSTFATATLLKRQPLTTANTDLITTDDADVSARRVLTTLHEVGEQTTLETQHKHLDGVEKSDGVLSEPNSSSYNGSIDDSNNKQKPINGTDLNTTNVADASEGVLDSASESGESAMDIMKTSTSNTQQPKRGRFNMSTGGTTNTRNSSRTSSFGNGLNFYSHLDGKKSLFSGSHHRNSNPLNNSTLSLTSLNRRQFNASIYGSTSALSDSRLLNTFSPFYKGKTTYGGAAAYNKYTAGTGANVVRITPTLIRPTSSLSSLSSSNISLSNNVAENSSISSTAKRILDLINDFATPLSEAKKMASNLKTNPSLQILPQAKGRLNESDLNASRAVRLSQVRSPYSRPTIILQPSGNASGRGISSGLLPPVKELQVPTMSQLLQMKKLQNTTEKARKIAQNSSECSVITEYSLPDTLSSKTNPSVVFEQDRQKHTSKIKNKLTTSLRPSAATKDLQNEEPPAPVNLPNIAFPLMESVPNIDIQLNKPTTQGLINLEYKSAKLPTTSEPSNAPKIDSLKSTNAFNVSTMNPLLSQTPASTTIKKNVPLTQPSSSIKPLNSIKFSEPIQVVGTWSLEQSITENEKDKYKFSPPLDVIVPPASICVTTHNTQPKQPQLKEGSCLDVLSKPYALPPILPKSDATEQSLSGFGNKFKKSSTEWECETCMIRNKIDVNKCVACETPRKQHNLPAYSTLNSSASFGDQFKKSLNEWECESCMLRNKEEITKCVACETPRKSGVPPITSDLPTIKNSFGDAFKLKPGNWECQTCMISNKSELTECAACQTKRPGQTNITNLAAPPSQVPATQFKFGFAADSNTNTKSDADESFKKLATQQKLSRWECDACMTRNDINRTKCACCEQPKPGTTSTESTNVSSTKFQFGATAASKFNFGFGTSKNEPTEEDLRKELSDKIEKTGKQSSTEPVLGVSKTVPAASGFQFGIKSTSNSADESKKDDTDGNKQLTGFKFGALDQANKRKISEASGVATAAPSLTGFMFGAKSVTATSTTTSTTLSSATAANSTNVKFSLPSTTITSTNDGNNDKPKGVVLPAFGFGTSPASSTAGGFSFGNQLKTKSSSDTVEEKKNATDDITFKAPVATPPKSSGFVFGSSSGSKSTVVSTAAFASSNLSTASSAAATVTATTTATSTAAVKPMHNVFATNTMTTPALNPQATSAFNSFSFGSNISNNPTTTTSSNTLFATVVSTSTTTTTATATATTKTPSLSTSSATTTTPASTNIFGSFSGIGSAGGSSGGSAGAPLIFGSSVNPPANNSLPTVSSSTNNPIVSNTLQFGTFGSKTASNVFGSFSGAGGTESKSSTSVKPNGTRPTLPVFGNVAPSCTSQSSQSNSNNFVFGANKVDETAVATPASAAGAVTSTSTTWPISSFVFGSTPAAISSTNAATSSNTTEVKEITKPSVFGTFGSSTTNANNQQQISSIFGASASNIGAALSASGTPAPGPTISSTNLFGTNSTSATTSIFGANSSGNAATPAPAFSSSPFGGAASSTSATPTFGSTAASGTTFGSFGNSSNNTITNTTEVKKPEAAFNFGAAQATQSTSGGFNFGSSASTTKPAFNFGGTGTTQQPTFNFTGSTESQSSTKPFQFGATPSAPVYNFNRGVLEGSPNAPFQFNAGAAPVSSNIFAPAPTPGTQSAQQAKRKMRTSMRRGGLQR